MAPRRVDPRFVTASGLVTSSRTLVYGAVLSGTGNCSLTLYDGATSNDLSLSTDRVCVLYSLRDDSKVWSPALPAQFDAGVIASGAGTGFVATVLVQERN